MMQVKLFELFDTKEAFDKLLLIFEEETIIKFSNKIIGITYNYTDNSYIDVLKKVKDLNLRQVINTSTIFINIINYCVSNSLFINGINFVYPVQEDSIGYLEDYLQKINSAEGLEKQGNKLKLFKEIDWIISDECIDLRSISFEFEKEMYTKVEFFNNGVILIGNSSVIEEVRNLVRYIYL
ncbi:hypothetical protein C1N83_27970 (plasmid) [Priestia aryabhattai]